MYCSVVIPVLNDALLLDACLDSLEAGSLLPGEVVVVDNGSVDGLREVLAAHPGLPITLIQEVRKGIPFAAATGYGAARGEVILRCDADSLLPMNWIEGHLEALRIAGGKVVAVSGVPHFGYHSGWIGKLAGFGYIALYRGCAGAALGHAALWGSNMAMRRSWWEQVSGRVHLSATVHDDFDLSFRLRPGERILIDGGSVVRVSWRALSSPRRWLRQGRLALGTVKVNQGD
ncbi:glycosyltransferase family 2 protein [Corynebacterium sp. A21]|uniref:glycosyltransferase family 2 protein n=1 Tax=Corynebacterium sp. A21 TaxID=3457318 RepID=UPI003FD29EEC